MTRDDKILVMHRKKFGQEYYTLIGGHVGISEDTEQALVRELHEETGLKIKKARLVMIEEAGAPYGTQYIYECQDPGGDVEVQETSDEWHINQGGNNIYEPMWVEIDELPKLPFRSEQLKQQILRCLKEGYPAEVIRVE